MKLIQKHAPTSFAELIFADAGVEATMQQYADGRRDDHLLLFGSTGTGKSTAALLTAAERCRVKPTDHLIQPLSGSNFSERDFEKIERMWMWQSMSSDHPTVVIDEVDQLKTTDLLKLRSFIDGAPTGTLICTTNHYDKLDHPLLNRFERLRFMPIVPSNWLRRAQKVLRDEGTSCHPSKLVELLETNRSGSIRELFSILTDIVHT